MAEKKSKTTIVSPLWSTGVENYTVDSWVPGSPRDTLGILSPTGNANAPSYKAGRGDEVNDWTEEFPDGNY